MKRSLTSVLNRVVLVILAVGMVAPAGATDRASGRVVAVGDVHGSLEGLTRILQQTGLVDGQAKWIGNDAILVQLGDLLDRGPDVREVMELLMRLQEEAAASGGEVVCLLGNHEAMNILGILRDVSPEAYAGFVDTDSEARRQRALEEVVELQQRRAEAMGHKLDEDAAAALREEWERRLPVGALEYAAALGPEGRYGRWLRSNPAAVQIGGTLFVHGGISPALTGHDAEAITAKVADEIARFDRARLLLAERGQVVVWAAIQEVVREAVWEAETLRAEVAELGSGTPAATLEALETLQALAGWGTWFTLAQDGPLWYRGAARLEDAELAAELDVVLTPLLADRIVVGHTVQREGSIQMRLGGRVFLIDTGMLASHYGGRAAALEIDGSAVTAIYDDERVELVAAPPPVWLDTEGQPLPFQSDAELEAFLREAEIVEMRPIGMGTTRPLKVTLERDGVFAHAAFKDVDVTKRNIMIVVRGERRMHSRWRDNHMFDTAAYRLDRLLGLNRVPPSVQRRLNGRMGTLTLWLERSVTDLERRERAFEPPDPVGWDRQRQVMHLFDTLTGNEDPNLGNTLIDRRWKLWAIDCSRCFSSSPSPPYLEYVTRCERGLWRALTSLDDAEIRSSVEGFLNSFEIKGLLKRRRKIVAHIESLIERSGEAAVLFDLHPLPTEPAPW